MAYLIFSQNLYFCVASLWLWSDTVVWWGHSRQNVLWATPLRLRSITLGGVLGSRYTVQTLPSSYGLSFFLTGELFSPFFDSAPSAEYASKCIYLFILLLLTNFIGIELIYNVVLVPGIHMIHTHAIHSFSGSFLI